MLLLLTAAVLASPPPQEPPAPEAVQASTTDDPHRVGIGVRTGLWHGGATAPMLGGQLTFRPTRGLRLVTFADHAAKGLDDVLQVDHVIGFHVVVPVVRWASGTLGPSLGSCVDFRTWRDGGDLGLMRADILFGPRAGLHAEHDVDDHWSIQGTATAVLYAGNTADTYGWGSRTESLEASGVVQAQVGLTRWW